MHKLRLTQEDGSRVTYKYRVRDLAARFPHFPFTFRCFGSPLCETFHQPLLHCLRFNPTGHQPVLFDVVVGCRSINQLNKEQ